ncbi:hypothetical protein BKI52_08175 [marine bacterium AO1-C]|nr:hypothetical protein BKI52_08175 [marine bacterium AO1-C]
MKYFEGTIFYTNKWSHRPSPENNRFDYYKGNYISTEVPKSPTDVMPLGHLHLYDSEYTYRLDYKNEILVYQLDNSKDIFTEIIDVQYLGKERIAGYKCDILELKTRHRYEGDETTWDMHFKQWVAPSLPLDPQYHNEWGNAHYFSCLAYSGKYCLVLKFKRFIREEAVYELCATEVEWQSQEEQKFTLTAVQHFKEMEFNAWINRDAPPSSYDEVRLLKDLIKLRQNLERGVTNKEKPNNFIRHFANGLETYLERKLTVEELEGILQTTLELMKSLPEDESKRLARLIFDELGIGKDVS